MADTEDKRRGLRERLARDHERLDHMFEELLCAVRADAREDALRLWSVFDDGLCRHMALEERYLLPELARDEPREAARLAREHEDIRAKLADFGVAVDLHELPTELVAEFIDQLRQHALREDAIAYRWTEGHLPEGTKLSLEAELEAQDTLRQKLVELGRRARERVRAAR